MISRCPHVATIGSIGREDFFDAIKSEKCGKCDCANLELWVCLREGCLFVGCGSDRDGNDHRRDHEKDNAHPLQINLRTRQIWCYVCNEQIFLNNDPPLELSFLNDAVVSTNILNNLNQSINNSVQVNFINLIEKTAPNTTVNRHSQYEQGFEPLFFEREHSDLPDFIPGTAGLFNLGNTCYMNSALQALSNCVPLTSYFLEFSPLIMNNLYIRVNGNFSHSKSNGRLAKAYLKFIESMWMKPYTEQRSDIINPSSIATEIRSINPSFRSYTQQDAQEFLRCFMDELHSEMCSIQSYQDEKQRTESNSTESSGTPPPLLTDNNESEYETCNSNVISSTNESSDDDDDDNDTKMKYSSINELKQYSKRKKRRSKYQSLSRTDSGVSLNTIKKTDKIYNEKLKSKVYLSNEKFKRPSSQSIISSIFDGQIQSQIECLTCSRKSTTFEIFQDLSLPIPSREQIEKFHSAQIGTDDQISSSSINQNSLEQNRDDSWLSWFYSLFKNLLTLNIWGPSLTLQDCLQAFFQADELTGDNMYSCEKCGKLRNGIKYCKVVQLPEVLCIHLKRFRHDSMIYTKIGSKVLFPLVDLDMKPFLHKDCESKVHLYDLFSCIVHHGRAGSGHYVTYALNSFNQQWYEYDDENVRQVDPTTVQNVDAYVLFYRKKEANISESYETIRHLLSTDRDYLLPFYISRSWINRYFYFAEPGPITNYDFLCKHGGVLPDYWSKINNIVFVAPESVWQHLYDKYGGYPVCNILYPCRKCQLNEEMLKRRQRLEKKTFSELRRSEKESDAIYAISCSWYKDWHNFVCERLSKPPGPISNTGISVTRNGVTRLLRRDCKHYQVSESVWKYLYSIYGGGPELLIQSNSSINFDDQLHSTPKSAATFV